uniref:Uncharacterized protein n=1 Tax=Globisporangium ultimum (strain ATCC 200006 / CBS 805.95 / DAOM BR144) TaxID=431595 RepID=K3WGP9_GLOUD
MKRRPRKVQQDTSVTLAGAHDDCAVQPSHFTIPLKPQDKPASFPANFAQAFKEEYAIKYLQKLGARPTPENVAMVLENLPLEDCHIATAWKSRGSLSDVVTIDLFPHPRPNMLKQGSTHPNSNLAAAETKQ